MRHLVFSNNGYIDDELKNLKPRECLEEKEFVGKLTSLQYFLENKLNFPFSVYFSCDARKLSSEIEIP